ncbi:MAG: ECF transporter S component [Ruminococcus sp.]|uniref:ECF transporter S component n=1 Tax=Ruminococcus sp. TaxID=41978 RepID=UPI002872AFAF|nr:ECF transporter S component [Ruminococcus sp.]MBQ3285137.1 ECF transporter S component [Ruminococcus sp.]
MIVIQNKNLRTMMKYVIPFVLIPVLVAISAIVFAGQRYIIISLGIAVLAILLFITGFERKNIGSRRMVITAIMTALAVFGRFIPLFKPITAICVMTAVYLGAEAGFLCGSMSVLISNIYFGQGPWTPFQMLGFGLIGLFAGYLSKVLMRSRWLMLLYGVIAGVAYSFIMDIWTVLWYAGGFDLKLYTAAIVSAIPFTLLYAVSNVVFLLILQKTVGNKLNRIKIKYGV